MVDHSGIAWRVIDTIGRKHGDDGWCGAGGASLPAIAAMVGGSAGDHLEIGSLWGASACAAALAMEEADRPGIVWCIDPMTYDSQEACVKDKTMTRDRSEKLVDVFWKNVRRLGVEHRIALFRESSRPWPFGDMAFGTAFIDGWHYDTGPIDDVANVRERVSTAIALDDIIEGYPAVMQAFYALCQDDLWFLQTKLDRTSVFRRRQYYPPF